VKKINDYSSPDVCDATSKETVTSIEQSELTARIEEYKALRAEVQLAIGTSINTLTFLFAGLGIVLTGGITASAKGDGELAALIFCVLIPATSVFGTSVWLGEVYRLRRASFYLSYLEKSIGLMWEHWLRQYPSGGKQKRMMVHNHRITFGFLAAGGLLSFICGLWILFWVLLSAVRTSDHPEVGSMLALSNEPTLYIDVAICIGAVTVAMHVFVAAFIWLFG
jgi:hypothetical protein